MTLRQFALPGVAGPDPADLPSEFQLFWPGENPSTKGSVWFDEVSALRVMADADTYKNEYPIDLEHRMVSPRIVDPNDSDTDAMAWHRLEVRQEKNGPGLWAVAVSWTPEGERRLRARSQRYTSPAFYVERDPDTGRDRVVKYTNCALCARPATFDIPPLVATDVLTLDTRTDTCDAPASMSKDRVAMAAALASLDAGDAAAAQSTLRAAVAEPEEGAPAAEDAPKEAEAEELAKEDEPPPVEEDDADEEYTRAKADVMALAGGAAFPAALVTLRSQALALTGAPDLRTAQSFMSGVLRERAERETAEVRALVTELVTLKAETPATAFLNNAPVPRLLAEGLPALRTRVAALRALAPSSPSLVPPPPGDLDGLSPIERAKADSLSGEAKKRYLALRRSRSDAAAR